MASCEKFIGSKGFSVLELIVAVAVTAILSGMLLTISTNVLKTQTQSAGELETNQVAQFVLDRIQEDLQCAVYQNDGNVWMAIGILQENGNSGAWVEATSGKGKNSEESMRIVASDWKDGELRPDEVDSLGQGPFERSRFGVGGVWLRFLTQAPEIDPEARNSGSARAVAYQIIRHGLTGSPSSYPKYQLFRSEVSAKNTFEAGYDLHPDSAYGALASSASLDPDEPNSPRTPAVLQNPILSEGLDFPITSFSLASNVIDLGVRAFLLERNSTGTGNFIQVFPPVEANSPGSLLSSEVFATSSMREKYRTLNHPFHSFPDVIDVMVRILTAEGARTIEAFEKGVLPETETRDWWSIAEEHSQVYFRRIMIQGRGI